MANFTTTKLTGHRTLVRGTDTFGTSGQAVLDSEQWDSILEHADFVGATEAFEAAVEQFFAPISEAADALAAQMPGVKEDPISFIELEPEVEGVAGQQAKRINLTHDSIVLRLLENNESDRLVWVGDQLEVLAADAVIDVPMQPETGAALDEAIKAVTEKLGGEVIDGRD